jgi:hypothetical protein
MMPAMPGQGGGSWVGGVWPRAHAPGLSAARDEIAAAGLWSGVQEYFTGEVESEIWVRDGQWNVGCVNLP